MKHLNGIKPLVCEADGPVCDHKSHANKRGLERLFRYSPSEKGKFV